MSIRPAPLLANDEVVTMLRSSLGSTEHGLGTVPNAVKVVIRDDMWRERTLAATGQYVSFDSFAAFVTTPPLEGLGATLDQLRGICRGDREALDAIDRATQNAHGVHVGDVDNVNVRPGGNASAAALRRLRKDRPDLHAEVLAGEKSPHAAMVEAGFRTPTLSVPLTAEGVLRAAQRLSERDLAELVALLAPIRDTLPGGPAIFEDPLFARMKLRPAQAIEVILFVCFPDAGSVLDSTWGRGRFWTDSTAPVGVVGLDLNPKRARHVVGDYRALPFADGAFDVGVFDPQFLSDGGRASIMRAAYTTHGRLEAAKADVQQGCREIWRVSRLGIIVKVQDHIHDQRLIRMTDWVREAIPAAQYDELLVPSEQAKVIDPKWTRPQLSLYRDHSAYLVFRKDGDVHKRRRARA
jgi:hypothetical protein